MALIRRTTNFETDQRRHMSREDFVTYSEDCKMLVIEDTPISHDLWDAQVDGLPLRILDQVEPSNASASLDQMAGVDLVWADLGADPVDEGLIARLQLLARQHIARIIWIAEGDALDQGYSAFGIDPDVLLLSAPNAAERAAAFMFGLSPRGQSLHDNSNDQRIHLAEEVNRIARMLADLSGIADTGTSAQSDYSPSSHRAVSAPGTVYVPQPDLRGYGKAGGPPVEPVTAAEIKAVIRLRRLRDQYFASDLFADPAWDMLLDLMAARLSGETVSVSSLCIAAAVPATTALRWIRSMTERGILERHADPQDGRRVFIALSDESAQAISRYFRAAKESGLRLG